MAHCVSLSNEQSKCQIPQPAKVNIKNNKCKINKKKK